MGKMLPVDFTVPHNSTDVLCFICRSPYGGLTYNAENETFRHRDPKECDDRSTKTNQRTNSV